MKRFLAAGVAAVLGGALLAAPHFSSAQSSASWNTFHGDGARDGISGVNGTSATTAAARYTLAASLPFGIPGSPVVDSSGTAYIGDAAGNLYAFSPDPKIGLKWKVSLSTAKQPALTTPTLSSDGKTIYVGSEDGNLYARNTSDGSKVFTAS
ncbi:MAG: PQQ-binding-like beta-propeller repeat protein, partial [Chloroflexota bacterium]